MLFPLGIGLALSFLICLIQWLQEKQAQLLFIGLDGMKPYLAMGAACLLVVGLAWVRFRPSIKTLTLCAIAIASVCFLASRFFRIDGYYGNRTPRFTWSWAPSPELEMKTYLASSRRLPMPSTSMDSFATTDKDFAELMGKDRLGKIEGTKVNGNWIDDAPKELWRHPVGLGWSSFSLVGNAAVSLEQRDEFECVVCYDLRTGVELWCHQELARFLHEYGDGPRSTPTIRNGRVYSMGATGILTCVELKSGQLIWKRSVFTDPATENLIFGMTGSPLVVDDLVVVTPGAGPGGHAIAFSTATGEEAWRSGDDEASYASPTVANVCGEMQILSFNGEGLRSFALNGTSLWLQPWVTQGESRVNVAQPIVLGASDIDPVLSVARDSHTCARILISSGYDKGTALIKVTRSEQEWISEILWESKLLKSKLSNIVVHNQFAFGLDNGILACINLENGERAWKSGRYGHGKILLVDDKLLIQAESGEIVMVEATNKGHRELARLQALSSKTWNYLALAGDILVVRNDREAVAIKLPLVE